LDPGAEDPGSLADAEGPSIQHSRLRSTSTSRLDLGVDLEARLDQACGAPGGEDLQALAAERPPLGAHDVNNVEVTKHGVGVGVLGLHAGWTNAIVGRQA
jgi:hypothetical protein